MKIVDMALHPIRRPSESALFDLSNQSMQERLGSLQEMFDINYIEMGLANIFDADVLQRHDDIKSIQNALATHRFNFSFMPDLRREDSKQSIEKAKAAGCCSIVFHSHLQEIDSKIFEKAIELALLAEQLDMFICVCAAVGSKRIYRYPNLPLAVAIAENVSCPVVLIHGGGARILEALCIAEAFPNVFLETSYSLPYWIGSSVERDFAFAMKKIGASRCTFGSDAPFWDFGEAFSRHMAFFDKHRFSAVDIEKIMGGTGSELLRKHT